MTNVPQIAGKPASHVEHPLYYNADGSDNGGTQVVDGTFEALRCCGVGYQLVTPREPTARDHMKGLAAAPCGVRDCPDGKKRRQRFHKAGWKKTGLTEALQMDEETAQFVHRRYQEHPEIPGLVTRTDL